MSTTRRLAALTTVALTSSLAATGLGVVAASPASAAEGSELRWGVSDYLNEHLTGQTFTDGAMASDGVVTFVDAVVDGDSVHYSGTARYAFVSGGIEYYSYSFSDVTVTLDGGEGSIAADVEWTAPTGPGTLEDVEVTTFSTDDDWTDGSLTATPDWMGVAPADTYGDGKPVDGASWAVDFVNALPSSLRGTFYASGSGNDPKKAPATFTAEAQTGPAVTAETAYAGSAVTIDVSGAGFTAVTEPGDAGVYVGLAPAGGLPDTDSQEDMDQFADAEWVMPAQMADGTFEVTLDPANADLDPRQDYAVYTWQAHSHSNPSQDTETPVRVDFSKLGSATKLKTATKGKKLVVTVGKGAAGKVRVKYTRGKATKKAAAPVKKGKAGVALPTKPTGKWQAVITYVPTTADHQAARKKVTVRVG